MTPIHWTRTLSVARPASLHLVPCLCGGVRKPRRESQTLTEKALNLNLSLHQSVSPSLLLALYLHLEPSAEQLRAVLELRQANTHAAQA